MVRIAALLTLAALAAAVAPASTSAALTPHIASCANSFPGDGHAGPWRTSNNGGTLHGNTLHVDCPNPSTHWSFTYKVQIVNQGQGQGGIINETRSGNGSPPDQSFNLSPFACDTVFGYRTHVDNNVTGGNINKPSGGGSVHLAC